MTLSPFERQLLSDAVDDFVAFWEVASIAKKLGLGRSEATRQDVVVETLESLWEQDLISFSRGTDFSGEEDEIRGDAVRVELRNPKNWDWGESRSEAWVQVAATAKGRAVYLAGD